MFKDKYCLFSEDYKEAFLARQKSCVEMTIAFEWIL